MFTSVILAAGMGTRMKSKMPKVLHKVCGKPLSKWVIDASKAAGADKVCAVVGHKAETVKEVLGDVCEFALQTEQKGTGHAVMQAIDVIKNSKGEVVILNGDTPLITAETINKAIEYHKNNGNQATVITAILDDATGYGRIVRDNDGSVLLNSFCKKAGEVINLDGIDMIAANAFNGCESINIINTEYVSICSEGAFKNSAVERLPFVNGVRMVGCMLVGIDNTCDNIVIPDDEINISTIISGLDWSHVKNVTVSHASTVYDMSMTAKAMPKKVTVMSVEGYELKTLKLANISYVNIVTSRHYIPNVFLWESLDGKCLIACPTGRTGRVDIPEGVEEIARNAFKLGNLEEVYFPSTLKKVGDMAFFYCKNLKKVDFGTGLEMIGSNAEKQCFASCDNLKSIIIPPQVTSIGSRVFENSAVNEICISEGLVSVSNNAFNGCPIKTVKLPESLKNISEDAFFGTDTVIARRYDTDLLSSVMKSLDRKIPFSYIKKEMDKSTGCSICLTDIIINERSALIPKYADNSITFSNIDAVLHMYFSSKTVPEKVMHEVRSMFMYFGKKDDREFMAIEMYLRDKSNDVAKEYIYSHSRHIIQNFVTNNRTEEEIMNFIKLGLMTAEACEYILDVAIKKEYTEISAYALNMLGKYPAEKQKFAL